MQERLILQTTFGPPKEEKTSIGGTKEKIWKKKFGNFFLVKHFLSMKKFPVYMVGIQKKKLEKIVCKKIFNTKNSEK